MAPQLPSASGCLLVSGALNRPVLPTSSTRHKNPLSDEWPISAYALVRQGSHQPSRASSANSHRAALALWSGISSDVGAISHVMEALVLDGSYI